MTCRHTFQVSLVVQTLVEVRVIQLEEIEKHFAEIKGVGGTYKEVGL